MTRYVAAMLVACAPLQYPEPPDSLSRATALVRGPRESCAATWIEYGAAVTAAHCTDSGELELYSQDGETAPAELTWTDDVHDLAIVRTDIELLPGSPVRVGYPRPWERVLVVGHYPTPWSLAESRVSAVSARYGEARLELEAFPGMSGSGVYNEAGEIVCVVTQRWRADGTAGCAVLQE